MKKNHFLTLSLGLFMPFLLLGQLDARLEYISNYQQVAIEEMERVGIPASIKMAQALLESGAGSSTLATQANNHFGIKCGSKWTGQTMYRKDDDYDDKGKLVPSCFRKYDSVGASFRAHSEFLMVNQRYGFLFELEPTDYKGWARGLKKAGYATSSTYANKLIHLIEEYELYLLDLGIYQAEEPVAHEETAPAPEIATPPRPTIVTVKSKSKSRSKSKVRKPAVGAVLATISINDVKNVKARVDDTPAKIAELTKVDVQRLIRYNEFLHDPYQRLNGGERVFLQPKRSSYRGRKRFHFVKEGDNMFAISQLYGIRLKKLYEKNRLDPGYEPAVGAKIKIRGGKVHIDQKPKTSWNGKQKEIIVKDFEWENEKEETVQDSESYLEPIVSNTNDVKEVITTTNIPEEKEEEIIWEAPKEEIVQQETPPTIVVEETPVVQPAPAPVQVYKPKMHTVVAGETLYRISKNYGISVEQLKAINDLSGNTLSIGQKLIVE